MIDKKGYEFSFAWIFAIIVGAIVIFLAVYFATKIIESKRFEEETKTGKSLGTFLNPLATNLEQAKSATIVVPDETKIFSSCDDRDIFGTQEISTAVKTGSLGRSIAEESGATVSFHDRYIFSEKEINGKEEFYVLSKPFELPFKIADVTFLWGDQDFFCFVNPLSDIEKELQKLNLTNVEIVENFGECGVGSKKVCFAVGSNCEILVDTTNKVVRKGSVNLNYVESLESTDKFSLLYAAIFSDPDIYECQVKRLMKRASALAEVYRKKMNYFSVHSSCIRGTSLTADLDSYISSTFNYATSQELSLIKSKAYDVQTKNGALTPCRLF